MESACFPHPQLCRITNPFPEFFLPPLPHLNPAKLKAFISLDSMTDELVFQAELILKIKQKQGPTVACKKPLRCNVSSLSESEINFASPVMSFKPTLLLKVGTETGFVCTVIFFFFLWCRSNDVCNLMHTLSQQYIYILTASWIICHWTPCACQAATHFPFPC